MKEIAGIRPMRLWSRSAKSRGKTIALVPTMGFLHEGHLSLLRRARKEADAVVMSIFVNPLQFGPREDFGTYPRDIKRDRTLARREGCDVLFVPSARQMYPKDFLTKVSVEGLQDTLCGASRPGHFTGVCTVVLKLVNIVEPHTVLFGQKDAQQAVILKRMLKDLNVDVRVIVCPTLRERDGLALSSRNRYLSTRERESALAISQSLFAARKLIRGGERSADRIRRMIRNTLSRNGISRVDYVAVVDARELVPLSTIRGDVLIAVAARVGGARLIDNIRVRV
ncbi:MAG: pantoate--beta-alanine ligase [Latescibacteria bacterium DG_63]|nr:MAG: pantoate--beta-alanine ligase [Latescibacteria bacterium DG_63]